MYFEEGFVAFEGEVNNSGYATVTYKSSMVWVDRVKNFKKLI